MDCQLTVGIPTYNRRPFVTALVRDLVSTGVETLVVDDASTDGTFDALAEVAGVRLFRNDANLGYAGSLLRVFEEARTPYLVVMSDDDLVVPESLGPLQDLLSECAPTFVSPQYERGGRLIRGRSACERIRPEECKPASSHAPGLVFRTDAVQPLVGILRQRLDQGCVATLLYPQVIVVAYLLAAGHLCLWWDRPISEDGALQPSGIRDGSEPYTAVASRWRQQQAFLDFYREQVRSTAPEQREVWLAMIAEHERLFFWVMRQSLELERPDLMEAFDAGAVAFYAPKVARPAWRRLLVRAFVAARRLVRALSDRASWPRGRARSDGG